MNAIETSVDHLKWLFTVVMALAITEGLKQFVREIKDQDGGALAPPHGQGPVPAPNAQAFRPVRADCTLGLLAFLVTVMPFTYGMTRYFFEAYKRSPVGENYFAHLSFDSLIFTIEALSFFVMSRSISPQRSTLFAVATLVVFIVDIWWVLKCEFLGLPSGLRLETWWIVLNNRARFSCTAS